MAYDVYQSAALMLRYGFAAAGAFIAGRAAYMTVKDGRRAWLLRAQAREAEAIGQLLRARPGQKTQAYSLPREGVAGSARGADVSIADAGLARRHFFFEIENGVLRAWPLKGARLGEKKGAARREIAVLPGGYFFAGDARFRFKLIAQTVEPLSPALRRAYGARLGAVLEKGRARAAGRADDGPHRTRGL